MEDLNKNTGTDESAKAPVAATEGVVVERLRAIRYASWAVVLVMTLAFAGYAGWRTLAPKPEPPTINQVGQSLIKSEFELVDHRGDQVSAADYRGKWLLVFFGFTTCPDVCPTALNDQVSAADYRGKWLLVFFGFTTCPDVCPTALNEIAEVMEKLGAKAAKVQPLFITVDPDRDTPERMAEFVGAFDPRITGLTGTPDQIKSSTKSFKVYYAKAVQKEAPDGYTMEHTTSLYLIDPKGRFVRLYSYNATVNEIADELQARL